MQGNITVAKSWNELNEWQVEEIANLYLDADPDNFTEAYKKMIFIIYQKTSSYKSFSNLRKLVSEVPISELEFHTSWLLKSTDYYKFPDIPGLLKPANALGDITIRHWSTIDQFYFAWNEKRSLINLKRLVASLYRIKENFDDIDLPAIDAITRHLPEKKMKAIALAYIFTRISITKLFPIVFPKPKKQDDDLKPIFKTKPDIYIPFDKMIIGIAMDELQPLGTKQDANKVRIYEFLGVLTESIIYYKQKAQQHERK